MHDEVIRSQENQRTEREHIVDSAQLLIYTLLLIAVILTIWLLKHKKFSYIHETGLALLYGTIFGAVIRYIISGSRERSEVHTTFSTNLTLKNISKLPDYIYLDLEGYGNHTFVYGYKHPKDKDGLRLHYFEDKATFNPEIFFNILLPPIIFYAGYSMKRKKFFNNFGAILMYAFLGTTISCFVVGTILYGFIKYVVPIPYFSFTDCYFFGAIISATDPVTTLSILSDVNVDLEMYSLIFGESILNDVVSIILAQQIEKYARPSSEDFNLVQFFRALGNFTMVFSESLLFGCIMGFFNAILTKFTHIRQHHNLETALFILISYSTFLAAEAIGASGIVAVLFCGICQAHYTYQNLSKESQIQTKQFSHILSFLSENFIFIYIGVTMFTFRAQHWETWFILTSFLAIFVGRAFYVYPLSFIINLTRSEERKIRFNMQNMLLFSGLRGAMAFSLAIRNTSTEARQLILTTTSIIVIVTVLFNGGLTKNMIGWLKIKSGDETQETKPVEGISGRKSSVKKFIFKYAWQDFDKNFMKPLLTNSQQTLIDTMPKCLLPISSLLTTNEQIGINQDKHLIEKISRDPKEIEYELQMEDVIYQKE